MTHDDVRAWVEKRSYPQAIRWRDGDWSEALDLLGQLEQTPETQARIERTVEAMLQAEQPEKSLEILTHWYELDTTHPDACYWLGAVAEAIQEKDLARSLWERAVQNRPGCDRARLALERMAASA